MKKKVHIVAHTHWDREWYFTIEDSNILLAENLKYVMDVLENNRDFPSYCFDAQASVVEEFLKVFPAEEMRLKKLVKEGRLVVGPWYTQTDTLLVNKESIIRNLLYGTELCNETGKTMKVGYLPDTFGQNIYLPSIFKGFGIESSIFKRGIYKEELKENLNFKWKSPDGQSIDTNYMILGYSPGEYIESSDEYISKHFIPMLKKADRLNKDSSHLLYLVGGDQNLIKKDLAETVRLINEKVDEYEVVFSGLEEFMEETFEESFDNVIETELRGTESQRVHRTIGSMRYDIKQLNSDVENKILNILEPLYLIGEKNGLDYPKNWLDSVWKMLFDAHAHDSIGGCNSDSTNEEVVNRLKKSQRIVEGLINLAKKRITYAVANKLERDDIALIFNCNIKSHKNLSKMTVFTRSSGLEIQELSGEIVESEIISQKYISGGRKIVLTDEGDKEFEIPGYYRSEVLIDAEVPSLGWETFIVKEINSENIVKTSDDNFISNERIKVSVTDSRIDLESTGKKIGDALYFEDCGDFGDSYDFSPLEGDKAIEIGEVSLLSIEKGILSEKMRLCHKVLLPKDLEERKAGTKSTELVIYTNLELRKGESYIRVSQNIDNTVKDHRVRMVIRTDLKNIANSYADSGFSIIPHEVVSEKMEIWKEENYVEAPVPIYNMENVAFVKDEKQLCGVITKGNKEYEVLEDGRFALTLYRGVGLLGRDDLVWRPNRASGINNTVVYTPDAQLLGDLEFEYAIYLDSEFSNQRIYDNVENYLEKIVTYQKQELNSFEERLERFSISKLDGKSKERNSLLEITNNHLYMSCCKKAHDGRGMIIRVFNPGNEEETARMSGEGFKVEKVNLGEEILEKDISEVKVPPKGYVSLRVLI